MRTRLRRIGKASSSNRILDALCRALVFTRDRNRCQKCGALERLQWCHVHSRRFLSLRWREENSLVLCAGDHLWWHHRPTEAVEWFNKAFPERAARLRLLAQTPQKVDRDAILLYLKQQS